MIDPEDRCPCCGNYDGEEPGPITQAMDALLDGRIAELLLDYGGGRRVVVRVVPPPPKPTEPPIEEQDWYKELGLDKL